MTMMSDEFDAEPFHPGQLVMVNLKGKALGAEEAAFLREHRVRGVCLFRWNLGTEAEVRQLTADLREIMGPAALIAVDQEGGSLVRATFLPQPPGAMALGAIGDAALAESVGAAVSRGLRSVGINWNFAPVLDVNNNPANPVIAERSFSEDPNEVARLAAAWMRGALREGVACCVKHFPGHGDTHVDSHFDLPVVDKPLAALEALELLPFRALRREAPAVMTAHIVYSQLDPEHPATLSRQVIGQLLRDDWGYDGVVITDSLVMKAIHERYGHHRAAVLALQAGADMVMALGPLEDQRAAVQSIANAYAGGALTLPQLLRARARLDALAARYPVKPGDYPAAQREDDDQMMRRGWALSLSAVGDARPPQPGQRIRVIAQRTVPSDGASEAGLRADEVAALFARFPDVELMQLDDLTQLDWAGVPADGRYNVLASNHRSRYRPNARDWRPDLHLVLWNPFLALDVPAPALVSWGYLDGALTAVQAWLEGRGTAQGRPPVRLALPH